MQLEISKTKVLSDKDFHIISTINPDLAEKMLRNKYDLKGSKHGNTKTIKEAIEWLETEIDGIVFVDKNNTSKFFNMSLYFENEEDALAFKLRWF